MREGESMNRHKISSRVYLIVGILACLLMTIQLILYKTTVDTIDYQQEQMASAAMKKLNSSIGSKISTLSRVTKRMISEGGISALLADDGTDWYSARHRLASMLKEYTDFLDESMYFVVFSDMASYKISTDLTEDEYDMLRQAYESYSCSDSRTLPNVYQFFKVVSNRYDEIYAVCFVPIKNWNLAVNTGREPLGTAAMCCKVNPKALLLAEQALQNTRITLHQTTTGISLSLLDDQPERANVRAIGALSQPVSYMDTEWKINCTIYPNTSLQSLTLMRGFIILDVVVILCMLLWLSLEFKHSVSRPLRQLTDYMESYHLDGDQTPLMINDGAEFGVIAEHINELLVKNKAASQQLLDMQSELYEASLEKVMLELQALQRQINPHFLYNTLECMHSIAVIHHAPEIERIACALSNLMRYATKGKPIVTLEEEISMLMDYIEIMKIRFPEKYTFNFDLPSELMGCKIPKMTIQPIFENVFKYANAGERRKICIALTAYALADQLRIVIRDNGRGIAPEMVEQIEASLHQPETPENHVGLYNVNRRIMLHCGRKCGISIRSVENEFTEVTIFLALEGQ